MHSIWFCSNFRGTSKCSARYSQHPPGPIHSHHTVIDHVFCSRFHVMLSFGILEPKTKRYTQFYFLHSNPPSITSFPLYFSPGLHLITSSYRSSFSAPYLSSFPLPLLSLLPFPLPSALAPLRAELELRLAQDCGILTLPPSWSWSRGASCLRGQGACLWESWVWALRHFLWRLLRSLPHGNHRGIWVWASDQGGHRIWRESNNLWSHPSFPLVSPWTAHLPSVCLRVLTAKKILDSSVPLFFRLLVNTLPYDYRLYSLEHTLSWLMKKQVYNASGPWRHL